jgi:hypothetical protein
VRKLDRKRFDSMIIITGVNTLEAKESEGVRECAEAKGPNPDLGGHQRGVSSMGAS